MKDTDDKAYDGANKYIMRFPKGLTPPVEGFWSLTMYDANYFFVAEPDQPLLDQPAAELEDESGRIDRPLHPEGLPRRGQGSELAAGAGRQVHLDAAHVLAGRNEHPRSSTALGPFRR